VFEYIYNFIIHTAVRYVMVGKYREFCRNMSPSVAVMGIDAILRAMPL